MIGKIIFAVIISTVFIAFSGGFEPTAQKVETLSVQQQEPQVITGVIKKGETFFEIFKKHKLDIAELYKIREAAASIHKLREMYPGRQYKIIRDNNERINCFAYRIDDDSFLNVNRTEKGYIAVKIPINYERKILHIGGTIKENLISSLEEGCENLLLAMRLSDILAWDIDFNTDLRKDDSFKIIVEGLYEEGEFKKYGKILSAEFINKGDIYHAYAFEQRGKTDYYDEKGRSLRKAFLKAPLSFRRISSYFSARRLNPVLKVYRPHHGLDYAAAKGAPVSATSDGKVKFAGRRGQYGNLIILRHRNGYETYYGHLSRIARFVRKGAKAEQGAIIGYVGATGLATGPHLHYEIRINSRAVNPMAIKLPRGKAVPANMLAAFSQFRDAMNLALASSAFSRAVATNAPAKPARPEEG
ncbi:MAG: peptidoglycan DD-metalloendopeptidase family protein [Syntrophales bacterium]